MEHVLHKLRKHQSKNQLLSLVLKLNKFLIQEVIVVGGDEILTNVFSFLL